MLCPFKHLTVGYRLNSLFHFCAQLSTLPSKDRFISTSHHQYLHHLLEICPSMNQLKQIHAQIIVHNLTNENLTLGKLVSFCAVADTGNLGYAQLVFDRICEPNKYMYNSLIRGYVTSDNPAKAISFYHQMVGSGLSPNEFTLPFVLKACSSKSAYWVLVLVHGQAIKLGIGSVVCVQNALISCYVVCGLIHSARQLFDGMLERTRISWNSIIGGYTRVGSCKEAFLLFKEMRKLGVEPDVITLVNLLSACSQNCELDMGRYVHLYIVITGVEIDLILRNALLDMYAKSGRLHLAQRVFDRMADKNVVSWTTLLGAYAKCGLLELAQQIFSQMPEKNLVSWNSMISCYVREGQCREALALFQNMCDSGVLPDEAALVSVLSACSQIGDLVLGKKTHNYVCSNDIIPSVTLYNSIIDMYAKCGALESVVNIFNKMPEKNLVSWNVVIGALALHGRGLEAINVFEEMLAHGISPDGITFTGLLSACSHSGLVGQGHYYFDKMTTVYRIPCEIEHYACMVDLLGRGGLLEEAVRLIKGMPLKPDVVVWGALLGACRMHGNVNIARQVLKQILELEPHNAGLYVLLSNLFCEAQRWEDVKNIRKLMNDRRIIKGKAISFIEIEGRVNEFMVADESHPSSSNIYSMLNQLTDHMKPIHYLCNCSGEPFDLEEL
ncbi:hypothetical protein SLA2020_469740 [Shorea laevis]